MNTKSHTPFHIAALTLSVQPATKGQKVQLFPDGLFRANDTRPEGIDGWRMDADIAAALIAKVSARTNDLVVDYEHQTLNAEENGKEAPASGWIDPQSLEYRPGEGLFAAVKWTATAQQYIDNDEYRYLSPVFPYHAKTGAILDVHNVALTNFPGLDGMAAVNVAALRARLETPSPTTTTQEDNLVERDELIQLLGLSADATDEQITAALRAAQTATATIASLRAELELQDSDDAVVAVAALKGKASAEPDPAKYVPADVVEALKGEIATLKNGQEETEVAALVQQGLDDGKLVPAQKDWAINLGNKDVAALKQYLGSTPKIAALKGTQTQGKKPAGADSNQPEMAEEATAVLKQLGVTAEDAAKFAEQENS